MAILPKLLYVLNSFSIKIPMILFTDLQKNSNSHIEA